MSQALLIDTEAPPSPLVRGDVMDAQSREKVMTWSFMVAEEEIKECHLMAVDIYDISKSTSN